MQGLEFGQDRTRADQPVARLGMERGLEPLADTDNRPFEFGREARGLVIDRGEIEQPAHPQHPIAPPPRMEPVAGAAQRATNVLDRVTGQAHADRLMAIGEFVVHDYLRKGASEGCHTEELYTRWRLSRPRSFQDG